MQGCLPATPVISNTQLQVKSMNNTTEQSALAVELDQVLTNHIAWMVCLAKLKELELGNTKVPAYLKGSLTYPDFSCLFSGQEAAFEISPEQWQLLFCRGISAKSAKPVTQINTIYQCRNFYGLDAPNNPASRLTKMVEGTSNEKVGKYDLFIKQWGSYAKALVEKNKSWEEFLCIESLADVIDIHWISDNPDEDRQECRGNDRISLIQRVLHLERERYIQILTTPVAALWPVWFLKSKENIDVLRKITDLEQTIKDFRVGKSLPEEKLFIDVNSSIGRMKGLPYPFGFADALLASGLKHDLSKLESLDGASWPTEAVNILAQELKKYFWSPPILFPVRANSFPVAEDEKENYPVPFIMVSEGCNTFSSIHACRARNDSTLTTKNIKFVAERQTYGEKILKKLDFIKQENVELLSRRELAKIGGDNCEGIDILASYFPANILAHVNDELEELSRLEIYTRYQQYGDDIVYRSLNIHLAGGMFLARQPKGIDLIIDLANYLQKIDLILNHVRPNWESLEEEFKRILYSNSWTNSQDNTKKKVKQKLAAVIKKSCADVASKTKLVSTGITSKDTLYNRLGDVGKQMISALIPGSKESDNKLRKAMIDEMEDWGWTLILEAAQYTSIYISNELFGGVKK
jgi:hypothetical protein